MSVQRRLLFGFALMLLPVLGIGAEAIRANAKEREAVAALGEGMARTRTFSELEAAVQTQSEVLWRALSGFDDGARREYRVAGEAVDYWQTRWSGELRPEEAALAARFTTVRRSLDAVADSLFTLVDAGRRDEAWRLAQAELRGRTLPALTATNRDIYGQLRQTSVRATYAEIESILAAERSTLIAVLAVALTLGLGIALVIAAGIARPIAALRDAMARIGGGDLDAAVPVGGRDELGQLAVSLARMRDDLRTAQQRLVQAEKLAGIGEMSAAVAHGLRNPLAGLRASAQLAQRLPAGSAAFQETLQGLVEETDRLDRRITDLLGFSRPAPHVPGLLAPHQLVQAVLPSFAPQCAERGVQLVTDVPTDLPMLRVDASQLEQVLVELLSNALQAMPGQGTITLTGRAQGGTVTLAVQDEGAGIPAATLPHVTAPFFTTRPDGTGLGLAVAHRYVEQNAGTLAITSTPGVGTTVTLAFPVAA